MSRESASHWTELWAQADWLRSLARQLGCDASAADDAVQETLLAARQSLGGGQAKSSLRGWLKVALRRKIGMGRRAEARRRVREQLAAKAEADSQDPLDALEREETGSRLAAAIAALPQKDRELIALRHAAGLSPAAIADSLGMTPNAVSSRLFRIHRRIREQLERDESSPLGGRLAALPAALGALIMKKTTASVAVAAVLLALGFVYQRGLGVDRGDGGFISGITSDPELESLADGQPVERQVEAPFLPETVVRAPVAPPAAEAPASAQELEAAALTGSILVKVTEYGTGRPAPNVGLRLVSFPGTEGTARWRWSRSVLTDAGGRARWGDLPAGDVTVYVERIGGSGDYEAEGVTVMPSEESVLEFTVDERQRIYGRVVDELDAPVPGARIWLSKSGGPSTTEGAFVATSGEDGSFVVPYAGDMQCVAASKPGYAPSPSTAMVVQEEEHGRRSEITLVLSKRRGRVFGRVEDSQGLLAAGARVVLDQGWGPVNDPDTGKWTRYWTPVPATLMTAADGLFEFPDVGLGEYTLVAGMPGGALRKLECTVRDGGHHEHVLRLHEGGTLRGTARSPDGEPVAGAGITVNPGSGLNQWGLEVKSDAQGNFELRGLGPGEVELRLEDANYRQVEVKTLPFFDGEVTRWDPVIHAIGSFRGAVRSSDGTPLVGWRVQTSVLGDGAQRGVSMGGRTDLDGNFDFRPDAGEAFRLRVLAPGVLFGDCALELAEVSLDDVPLELTVPVEAVPAGTIVMRLAGVDGEVPEENVHVTLEGEEYLVFGGVPSEAGRVELRYLPKMKGTLTVEASGLGEVTLEIETPLEPGEIRDLGDLVLTR